MPSPKLMRCRSTRKFSGYAPGCLSLQNYLRTIPRKLRASLLFVFFFFRSCLCARPPASSENVCIRRGGGGAIIIVISLTTPTAGQRPLPVPPVNSVLCLLLPLYTCKLLNLICPPNFLSSLHPLVFSCNSVCNA